MTKPARTRRRGAGSITSYSVKGGNRWRWQLWVPINPDAPDEGSRQAGGGGFTTASDADDALQDARAKLRAHHTIRAAGAPTIATYTTNWLDGLRLENSTMVGYRGLARNHVIPQLGSLKIDKLTATRLARHYEELLREGRQSGGGLSVNTVNKVHVLIGAMLDSAIDDGHLTMNPARRTRTVKAPTGKQIRAAAPEILTLTAAQLRALMTWNRDQYNDHLHALWLCIAHTGMRRGEVLALRWADVDLTQRRISVRRATDYTERGGIKGTKTGQSRVVDIDDDLAGELRKHKVSRGSLALELARGTSYVFGDDNGELFDPKNITARWSVRLAAALRTEVLAELPHVTIKGLRHTHATLLLELGVHPKVVQERLGHSNISTTMNIYSHVTPTMQRDAVERLAQLLS